MARLQPERHQFRAESGLTESQVQIWIGQTLHPASALYNMTFAFVIEGNLEADIFRAAWRHVATASDALRTSIVSDGGIGRRVVHESAAETTVLDLTARADPLAAFHEWARERCSRPLPFDGPLVDSTLVRLEPARWGWYLNQHHVITDASSTVLLVRELSAEYQRLLERDDRPRRALALYYETAAAIRTFPDAASRDAAAAYWQERVATNRVVAFYGQSHRASSTRSERLTLQLDARLTARLQEVAEEPGFLGLTPDISRFTLFAAILTAWLRRVSGQRDVGFDAPAHNRPTAAAKRSLGLFIEMFPFAVQVDGTDTFRTLAARCSAEGQGFLRYALPGTGSAAGAAASNVVLNYFSGTHGGFAGLPMTSTWLHPGESDSVHSLRLQVHDYNGSGGYTLQFDFNEEIFPAPLRTRALRHFQRLLDALAANPDERIDAVDILDEAERNTILVDFNETDRAPAPSRPVTASIAQQATRTPERIAIREGSREITFGDLHQRVRTAAASLVRLGVRPGEPVAVLMPRSADTVIAILSVLEARACYVPLDTSNPKERLDHILSDCGARHAIVSSRAPGLGDVNQLAFAELLTEPAQDPALDPPRLTDVAYIIYTSGSTGAPKGVPIDHEGLADYLEWAARQYVRGDVLSVPLFTSLAFDLTVTSLFLPLTTGGTLVVYPESDGAADTALMRVVADNLVDLVKLTPAHLSLLRHMDLSRSRIRRMIVGGEDLKTHLARSAAERFPAPVEIYNEYGPTEAVVGCMIHRYDPEADCDVSVPIGRPADHVRLYVLNESLTPVPAGVPGELCISRLGLSRGYRGAVQSADNPFTSDPFREGGRIYRTGDLVRFNDGGTLTYLGRQDRQLKVSGIRVEPGEIEAALLAHDAVLSCHVAAQTLPPRAHARVEATAHCARCGLPSNYPGAAFDEDGVCETCRSFGDYEERVRAYFRPLDELEQIIRGRARGSQQYDCMMLLSGGKDSTYALCRLVDMGLRVYAFSFDNGYISEQAKGNIRRVTSALGVEHEFATTAAMPAIFRDSLMRFSNVCNGCFKTIYTLSIARAQELGIPAIVTGLSRGQLFETRLTPDLFSSGHRTAEEIDAAVLAARKAYHRADDEVARSLDVSLFRDDRIFDEVAIVDFYRYCDVGLDEVLAYLGQRVPWMRPSDTGRSTNCLANDVGIFVHLEERGYHNYALPYSWDVRLGHKTRAAALYELHDQLDMPRVQSILGEVGYEAQRLRAQGPQSASLTAYYVSSRDVGDQEMRQHLSRSLPSALIPSHFVRVPQIPLTAAGKVDERALASTGVSATAQDVPVPPQGIVEERIAAVWCDILRLDAIGARTSFFALGGTSLGAMEVVLRICSEFGVDLPLQAIFTHPTIADLAASVEALVIAQVNAMTDDEVERLAADSDSVL